MVLTQPQHRAEAPGDTVATGSALAVRRLALTDFRAYPSLVLEVGEAPVVLTGPNGAGKTNLLESISFLGPGRGLRSARLAEVTRRGGAGGWAVAARMTTPLGEAEVGTGIAGGGEQRGERRAVKIDGQSVAGPAKLAEVVALSWLTPQMDRLFLDGAGQRRRFFDRLVFGFDSDHARRVSAFERAMRERNRVLATVVRDGAWLGALEETMAGHAVAVAAARRVALGRLRESLRLGCGPFPGAEVALDGTIETWLDEMPALTAEDRYRERLEALRRADAGKGGATEGPHRTDLDVRHVGNGVPAAQCSTGEQKALLIAIVLANARLLAARRRCAPLLLLDEVVAHLDAARRQALFDVLRELAAQAWLTGTDDALFAGLRGTAQFLTVRDGVVTRAVDG